MGYLGEFRGRELYSGSSGGLISSQRSGVNVIKPFSFVADDEAK
jgi:hypothetical protein